MAVSLLVKPPAPVIPTAGLSLWLKADAGITYGQYSYKSRIVLSGTVSGTFNATSVPVQFGSYTLTDGTRNMAYTFDGESSSYYLPTVSIELQGTTSTAGYASSDGNTWSAFNNWVTPTSISGLSGEYIAGNGQYEYQGSSPSEGFVRYAQNNLSYSISGYPYEWTLRFIDNDAGYAVDIATNSDELPNGSWIMLVDEVGSAFGTGSSFVVNSTPPTTVSSIVSTAPTTDIAGWADQSGNGRNATTENNAPLLNPSGLNNKPTLTLSGWDEYGSEVYRTFRISGNPMGASGTTAFFVSKLDYTVLGRGDQNGTVLGDFSISRSYIPSGITGNIVSAFASTSQKTVSSPAGIRTWNLYSVFSQTGDWGLFFNGTQLASSKTNVYSNAIGGDGTTLKIGKQTDFEGGNPEYFKGEIAEIMVFNRVLSAVERQQVEAYLRNKYGFGQENAGIPTANRNVVRVVIPSIGLNNTVSKDATNPNSDGGIWNNGNLDLNFGGQYWYVANNGTEVAYNTIPNQSPTHIPETRWSIPVTLTALS